MHAGRHEVVHQVVLAGDGRKHALHAAGFFIPADVLEPEGDLVLVHHPENIGEGDLPELYASRCLSFPKSRLFVADLLPAMEGKRILRVETRRKDLRFPFPAKFNQRLDRRAAEASRTAREIPGRANCRPARR